MPLLEIVKFPDPRLREETFKVATIDDDIRALVRDMTDTMYSLNAAGIAAIQVGRLEQIFLIDGKIAGDDDDAPPLVFINPKLLATGQGAEIAEEGCLSFPDVFVDIQRPRWAKLRAQNLEGELREVESDGFYGRALQHEFDHLTGKLMIDLVGMVKKQMIKRKMKRWHNTNAAPEHSAKPSDPVLA
jgi:peptide deformylase